MDAERDRLWPLGVLAVGGVATCLALDLVRAGLAALFVSIFLSAVIFLQLRQVILLLILVAPLTQAPTVKLGLRWSLPGVLAWLLLPAAVAKLPRFVRTIRPLTGVAVAAFGAYVACTAAVGVLDAASTPSSPLLAAQFGSPLLRTLLETARFVGVFAVGVVIIWRLRERAAIKRALVVFAFSGAAVALYGLYQAAVLRTGLPLPFLPGTLSHSGTVRPFSTFFEPTGLGSHLAVSLIFALYAVRSGYIRRRWTLVLLFPIVAGLLVSTARAGLAAAAVGLIVLLLLQRGGLRTRLYLGLVGVLVIAAVQVTFLFFGEKESRFAFSSYLITTKIEERIEGVEESAAMIVSRPLGVGQGLYVFQGLEGQGAARLISESGMPGLGLLLILHSAAVIAVFVLHRERVEPEMVPYLAGGYAAAAVATLNYQNLSDVWIWIPIWLVVALAQGAAETRDRVAV